MKRRTFLLGCGALGVGGGIAWWLSGRGEGRPGTSPLRPSDILAPSDRLTSQELEEYDARFGKPLPNGKVSCELCPLACELGEGERGRCLSRLNRGGQLKTLQYDRIDKCNVLPTSAWPLFGAAHAAHRYDAPTLYLALTGCNLDCDFCSSPDVAQVKPESHSYWPITAEELVDRAWDLGFRTLHLSGNEPTTCFESVLEISKAARAKGLGVDLSTHGWMSTDAYEELFPHVTAVNFGFKSFEADFYRTVMASNLEQTCESVIKVGAHAEKFIFSYVYIPGRNTAEQTLQRFASWTIENFGDLVPILVFAFMPSNRWRYLPACTQDELLAGKRVLDEAGLRYVSAVNYLHPETYVRTLPCHHCGEPLLERDASGEVHVNVIDGIECKFCGTRVVPEPRVRA